MASGAVKVASAIPEALVSSAALKVPPPVNTKSMWARLIPEPEIWSVKVACARNDAPAGQFITTAPVMFVSLFITCTVIDTFFEA